MPVVKRKALNMVNRGVEDMAMKTTSLGEEERHCVCASPSVRGKKEDK